MTADFLLQLLLQVWLPIALLVTAGGLWVRFRPQFPADTLRVNLNRLVVDVFGPPLLFALSAQAEISRELLTVPVITIAGIGLSFVLLYPLLFHSPLGRGLKRETRAAILLAGCFSNVLFMGYPTLTFLYGDIGGSYAAFADVLATTPLVWTFGVWIATRLGHEGGHGHSLLRTMLTLPMIWGFTLGFAVNLSGWTWRPWSRRPSSWARPPSPSCCSTWGCPSPGATSSPARPVMVGGSGRSCWSRR
jgi:predicted permease